MKRVSGRYARLGLLGLVACGLLIAGAAPASAATKTFKGCASGPAPLLDRTSNSLSVRVPLPKDAKRPQIGSVEDLTVGVRITHTGDSDLALTLISPSGVATPVAVSRGGGGDGFGSGAASCAGSLVRFNDFFAIPISNPGNTGNQPVTGDFRPEHDFTNHFGRAFGLWTLLVSDAAGGDTGTIDAFSLKMTYRYKKLKKKGG